MTYNEANTKRVREALADEANVEEKKMFGSVGFIVNGKLCIGVGDHNDHAMMVRVGPDAYHNALKRKHTKPAIMRGNEMRGYIFLDDAAFKTEKQLQHWVMLALRYNAKILQTT